MTVTNKRTNEDARKVVHAVANNPDWDIFYWNVASQHNGSKKALDRRIYLEAEKKGYNGIKILDNLRVAFDEYKAASDKLKAEEPKYVEKLDFERAISDEEVERIFGSYNKVGEVAENEIAGGLKKLKKLGGKVGLGHLLSSEEQKRQGLTDEGKLADDYNKQAEGVLNTFFACD